MIRLGFLAPSHLRRPGNAMNMIDAMSALLVSGGLLTAPANTTALLP